MTKLQMKIASKIGSLYLVGSAQSLHGVFWEKQNVAMVSKNDEAFSFLKKSEKQITEYLDGKRQKFDLPLEAEGTDFQKKVWKELARIPYGETRSYKDIAIAIKNPKACRAVGTANGKNPLSIIVPCHRVISADGSMGGFGGGLDIKEKLLVIEKKK
jgi:methylated-DNA-[protein]-cysteine S-methyltransferase